MAIGSFKDLDAWRVGMDLMLRMYEVIKQLPPHERFEMASQMRRAAASIPSNVAEGHACRIRKRYRYHVHIALGSVAELATNVEAGRRLSYWDDATALELDSQLIRMTKLLNGVLRGIWKQLLAETTAVLSLIVILWLSL